jgi:hypothetical protein
MPNIFEGAHLSDNAKVTGDALVFGNCVTGRFKTSHRGAVQNQPV